jgi:DNA repair protein RecO (recombination protein O)
MRVHTKAIVLSSIKYADSSLIVKAFTESDGLKSYILRGVLATKKGKVKAAYFLPLSQLELVATHKNNATLDRISEVKTHYHYQSAHSNLVKNSLVLFLSEVLSSAIVEEEENKELFLFLSESLMWMDQNDQVGNFHIQFLIDLSRYLGFYPDHSTVDAPYFNLVEGAFSSYFSNESSLNNSHSDALKLFLGTNFDNSKTIKLDKNLKIELIKSIMNYYRLHLNSFKSPKSLEVLNVVFSSL